MFQHSNPNPTDSHPNACCGTQRGVRNQTALACLQGKHSAAAPGSNLFIMPLPKRKRTVSEGEEQDERSPSDESEDEGQNVRVCVNV